jgi:ABC-type dipeptide/oligopeptide/nickel transport system permease component
MGEYASRSTPEEIQVVREYLGTDRSIVEQYVRFVARVATGDLGVSIRNPTPVIEEIAANLPSSLALVGAGLLLAIVVGVPIGVLAATRRGRLGDYVPMTVSMLAIASPSFWFAILLVYFLGYRAGWFPIFGAGQGALALHYLALPAIVIGTRSAALVARMTRSAMLEVLNQEYIRTAFAKGLRQRSVLYGHALKNAAVPIVTIIALDMAYLLSGAVVVEIVFSRPGLGKLLIDALYARDYPVVQGAILTFAAAVVLVNALTDVTYRILDPRLAERT